MKIRQVTPRNNLNHINHNISPSKISIKHQNKSEYSYTTAGNIWNIIQPKLQVSNDVTQD